MMDWLATFFLGHNVQEANWLFWRPAAAIGAVSFVSVAIPAAVVRWLPCVWPLAILVPLAAIAAMVVLSNAIFVAWMAMPS